MDQIRCPVHSKKHDLDVALPRRNEKSLVLACFGRAWDGAETYINTQLGTKFGGCHELPPDKSRIQPKLI